MGSYLYYSKRAYTLDSISDQVNTPVFNRENQQRFYDVNSHADRNKLHTPSRPIILPGDHRTELHRFPRQLPMNN